MKEKMSYLYKMLIVIVGIIGLMLNFSFMPITKCLIYFTILANICCILFYVFYVGLRLLKKISHGDKYYIIKGMMSVIMIVTMFMYQFMALNGSLDAYKGHELASSFVHIILPIMVILDYVWFDHKGNIKWYYAFIWCLFLIAYGVLIILYSQFGGSFYKDACMPYDFLDWNKNGVLTEVINNVFIYLGFIFMGFIIYLIDKKSGKKEV